MVNENSNQTTIQTESKSSIKFWRLQDGSPRWEIKVYKEDAFQIIDIIESLDKELSQRFFPFNGEKD